MEFDQKSFATTQPVRIVLTGFRATGKTSVGRALASVLGYDFLDTDQKLVDQMGCGITDHVEKYGWESFRALERSLLEELCSTTDLVIATGGGAIIHRDQWARLAKDSLVVWLKADASTICTRMAGDAKSAGQRPSLTGKDAAAEVVDLLAQRDPLYRAGSHLVVDTVGMTIEHIVARIKKDMTIFA